MPLEDYFAHYGGMPHALPEIAGRYKGRNLVVCGDAACVWEDLEAFGCRHDTARGSVKKEGWDFLVINKLGETFPGWIEHWYSNEPHSLKRFADARRVEYASEFGPAKHLHSISRGVDWRWPFNGRGTSGLSAILVGIALGYERIVLCGLPLDDGPHNGEPHWRKCRFETSEAASPMGRTGPTSHWKRAIRDGFDGKVVSMSGRTRLWMGAPE